MGGGNRSKGLALLRAIRNNSTGSLLCRDGSRMMTQAHFLRLGSRHVLHSAEVEVVLPALLAKLWARLVLDQLRKGNSRGDNKSTNELSESGSK